MMERKTIMNAVFSRHINFLINNVGSSYVECVGLIEIDEDFKSMNGLAFD